MNKWVKLTVLQFMEECDTANMNTNEFILKVYNDYFWKVFSYSEWPSFEWISRARRTIIKSHWIGKRTNATEEIKYIDEYCLKNKY